MPAVDTACLDLLGSTFFVQRWVAVFDEVLISDHWSSEATVYSYSLQLQSTVRRFGKVFGLVCSSKLSACLNEWAILRRVSDSTNRDRNKNNRENTAARTTATTASLWMVLWKTTYSENAIVQNADLSHWLQCKQLKLKKMVYAAYAIEAKKIRVLRSIESSIELSHTSKAPVAINPLDLARNTARDYRFQSKANRLSVLCRSVSFCIVLYRSVCSVGAHLI